MSIDKGTTSESTKIEIEFALDEIPSPLPLDQPRLDHAIDEALDIMSLIMNIYETEPDPQVAAAHEHLIRVIAATNKKQNETI